MSLVGHNNRYFGYNTPIFGYLGVNCSDVFGGYTYHQPTIVIRRTIRQLYVACPSELHYQTEKLVLKSLLSLTSNQLKAAGI